MHVVFIDDNIYTFEDLIRMKKQNLKLQSGFLIHMPDNYIPAMGAQKESSQQKNFKS